MDVKLDVPKGLLRPVVQETEPSGKCAEGLAFWESKRGKGSWPTRSDVDPFEIRRLLPNLCLWDVVGEPPRFRLRLIGTRIVEAEGQDNTGRWSDEVINPSLRDTLISQYTQVVREGHWHCHTVQFTGLDLRHYAYQRILMPLGDPGPQPNMLLGIADFLEPQRFPDLITGKVI